MQDEHRISMAEQMDETDGRVVCCAPRHKGKRTKKAFLQLFNALLAFEQPSLAKSSHDFFQVLVAKARPPMQYVCIFKASNDQGVRAITNAFPKTHPSYVPGEIGNCARTPCRLTLSGIFPLDTLEGRGRVC